MRNKYLFLIITAIYIILALFSSLQIITSVFQEDNPILMIPENAPLFLENYYKIMIGDSTWNELLSQPSWGFDALSYRTIPWGLATVFNLELTHLLIIEKI